MKNILFIWMILGFSSLHGQNLIPNPSFEDYSSCPDSTLFTGDLELADYWIDLSMSPDYFHPCATNLDWSVPFNFENKGFQYPHSGQAYAGFFSLIPPSIPSLHQREYVTSPFLSTLEKDSFYLVEFYLNSPNNAKYACDCIDVWLTDSLPEGFPNPNYIEVINGEPQLQSPKNNFLTDTLDWMRLSWIYQAKGNEEYIIIGNFKDNEETDFIEINYGNSLTVYHYIDDVTVKKIPSTHAQLNIGNDTTICTTTITKTLEAPLIYDSYLWNTGSTNNSITINTPGTYWVDVEYDGCFFTDTIYIEYQPEVNYSFDDSMVLCPDELPFVLYGPADMDNYDWSTGEHTDSILIDSTGWYYLDTQVACRNWTDSIYIQIEFPNLFDLGSDTILCNQPFFTETLSAAVGYDAYLWSTGETSRDIDISTPGIYWVTADYLCGQISDTITIINQISLALELGNDTTFCQEESFTLQANLGFNFYHWSTDEFTSIIEINDYGTYFVEASNFCETQFDTITFFSPPDIWLTLPNDTSIILGDNIELLPDYNSDITSTFNWTPSLGLSCNDCPAPFALPSASILYQLTLTDEYGCSISDDILIEAIEQNGVYIPNAFTPNEDGNNDIFTVYAGQSIEKIIRLEIFDRYGEAVFGNYNFSPNDTQYGWDGKLKGEIMNSQVFVAVVEVLFRNGTSKVIYQDLTLYK
jgi:gliding motility-associated-like protein